MLSSAMFAGVMTGLAVTMPIGPMAVLCIHRTMALGLRAGLATGLGAVTVLLLYSAITLHGMRWLPPMQTGPGASVLHILAGAILVWFSIRMAQRTICLGKAAITPQSVIRCYREAVAVALVNPMTPVLLASALATFETPNTPATLLGVLTGSIFWWLVLASAVACLRHAVDMRWLRLLNLGAAAMLALFGARLLWQAI